MKNKMIYALSLCFALLSCTTTALKPLPEMPQETKATLASISAWTLGFEYPNTTWEEKTVEGAPSEVIIKDHGYSDFAIATRDNVYALLKERHGIRTITKEKRKGNGTINFHIMRISSNVSQYQCNVRIFFKDTQGVLIHEALLSDKYGGSQLDDLMEDIAALIDATLE